MSYVLKLASLERQLERRWVHLLTSGKLGFKASRTFALFTFAIIAKMYGQDWRRYHTLFHSKRMLDEMHSVRDMLKNPYLVEFAIFLHDIVYVVGRKDNEKMCGKLARSWLKEMRAPSLVIRRIVRLIVVATKHPKSEKVRLTNDEKFMSDFDLLGFSLLWPEVVEYSKNVRREYSMYEDMEFIRGHHDFLHTLMYSGPIYKTKHFNTQYEIVAQENIFAIMKRGREIRSARLTDKRL